ncbi:hypothetical protein IGI04_011966 [Brassica rapa subsp. trilocularis]|uniref:Uncharacterized protein n=4 Tax=Brassica TaxID=3705 RepID=A0A8D9GL72_BRACM|nr:hypothetical protein IGI04_011966 [Brassica rapa subsp. trilocularis]CAF2127851.1 unnamed protein product [Brassica napus]CAG7882665.1 unnamed protein product [Brassica rapa]
MSGYRALTNFRQNTSETASRQYETDPSLDENIDALLEEEEAMMVAHRKEMEDTLRLFARGEEQPGSLIESYVKQLSFVLSRQAAGLVSLQAKFARSIIYNQCESNSIFSVY